MAKRLPKITPRMEAPGDHRHTVASMLAAYLRAIQAATIICIWWKIIRGRIAMPTAGPEKRTLAMGTPVARLFFEPQKTMATSSGFEKPRRRAAPRWSL